MSGLPLGRRAGPAPADVALSTLVAARAAAVVLHVPVAAFVILNTSTSKLGSLYADLGWLPLALLALALQGYLVVSTILHRRPPWAGGLVFAAVVACSAVILVNLGQGNVQVLWLVAAAGSFALPRRLGVVVLIVTMVLMVGLATAGSPQCQCWDQGLGFDSATFFYYVVASVTGCLGPFMAARLLEVVDDLARSRAELELTAADEERLRLSRDLHDALGQGLSAVALKGDLAVALMEKDPVAAEREIDSLIEATQRIRHELPDILVADAAASYDVEARRAERLLREAGVVVRRTGDLGQVSDQVDAALGWVVREAATNVLRHSEARQWTVLAGHRHDAVWLEATNDRPLTETGPAGSGLLGMTERLRAIGGRVRTQADAEGFTLRVEVAV